MSEGWTAAPVELEVDLQHGGRWTSLRSAGRDWLWTHPDPDVVARRPRVRPGEAFVDAGGVEECFPTVRGEPDHGDAWSRPWAGTAADAAVALPDGVSLRRTVRSTGSGLEVGYRISGAPGTRFVHAVHALLDLGPAARLVLPGAGTAVLVDDGPAAELPWPSGLDALGPEDGTATCVIVPRCGEAVVVDGDHALTFTWTSPSHPDLCSLMLWRNLGGWPDDRPYRSIGIEPMIGRTAERDANAAFCCLDASGQARWTLRVAVVARHAPGRPFPSRP